MRHQPSACAMLRRSAACVRPSRRGERDANAEEATGEKQLLRLERPFQTAATTYNVIRNARPSMTNQENEEVIRCRTCYIALTGGSPTPPHCPLHGHDGRRQATEREVRGRRADEPAAGRLWRGAWSRVAWANAGSRVRPSCRPGGLCHFSSRNSRFAHHLNLTPRAPRCRAPLAVSVRR